MAIQYPLGIDSFRKLREEECCYVDKTGFIKELVSQRSEVTLITRPRRFGKTLAMSMLEDFFDMSRDSTKDFTGLGIMEYPVLCARWMNQWPTIFLALKSVDGNTFASAKERFRILMSDLCKKYSFLEHSNRVDKDDREYFQRVKANRESDVEACDTLYLLTRMMNAHYGRPVVLLIDEYDVPLAKASSHGYYGEMLEIVRALSEKALKSNEFLKFAVVTGCLKIAKESIFTGTNHFVSDTVTGDRFDRYLGFTGEEVQGLLDGAGFPERADELKHWYDGYHFGSVDVYCPWDVLNHMAALQADAGAAPRSYWENTSHNGIIRSFIERKDLWREEHINEDFENLLAGKAILKTITENLTYDTLHSSAENLWSLLYLTGYLTQAPDAPGSDQAARKLALKIPNEEICRLFRSTVAAWFRDTMKTTDRSRLFGALWGQDAGKLSGILSQMVFGTISYHDYKEDYYHAFLAGALSFAGYRVKSNAEAGEGRPDLLLLDEQEGRAAVFEIKKADTFKEMEAFCNAALKQIQDRKYAASLGDEYQEILCYGICFFKKRCLAKVEKYR